MERLQKHILRDLDVWDVWDGRAIPAEGSPAKRPFDWAWQELCGTLEYEEPDDSLPEVRSAAGALCMLLASVNTDWLHTGVVLNQPELIPRVEDAAERFAMPATASLMQQVRSLVPVNVLASEDFDERLEWYTKSQDDPQFRKLVDLSDVVTDGPIHDEIVLAVVRAARDNPDAFFKPA